MSTACSGFLSSIQVVSFLSALLLHAGALNLKSLSDVTSSYYPWHQVVHRFTENAPSLSLVESRFGFEGIDVEICGYICLQIIKYWRRPDAAHVQDEGVDYRRLVHHGTSFLRSNLSHTSVAEIWLRCLKSSLSLPPIVTVCRRFAPFSPGRA